MRITEVIKETDGKKKGKEGVSFVNTKNLDSTNGKDILNSSKLYDKAVEELRNISKMVIEEKGFSLENLKQISKEFVDNLTSSYNLFLHALYREEQQQWDFAVHSTNIAIIAFKIGKGMNYKSDELNGLLLCAFLHDLGMIMVPEELRNKPGKLVPKEFEVIKNHPRETYNILKKLTDKGDKIAEIVYQEHEREDGSGYPKGLKGEEIHEYAKIIGLADVYGALIQPRPQRKRFLPFEAVKQIIAVLKESFPKDLLKAMINELSAFPLGIYVKLNTNEVGRVVAVNRLAPLRPTIEILIDSSGRRLKETRTIDMSQHQLVDIKETFFMERN